MKRFLMFVSFIGAFALSSQAMAVCFNANQANGYRVLDRQTVDVHASFGEVYRLHVGFCSSLQWADRLGFERFFVCPGDNLLVYEFNRPADRCWIQQIQRIR